MLKRQLNKWILIHETILLQNIVNGLFGHETFWWFSAVILNIVLYFHLSNNHFSPLDSEIYFRLPCLLGTVQFHHSNFIICDSRNAEISWIIFYWLGSWSLSWRIRSESSSQYFWSEWRAWTGTDPFTLFSWLVILIKTIHMQRLIKH